MRHLLPFLVLAACSHPPELRTDYPKPPIDVPVGQQPSDVAIGDLDGDSQLDLVSANSGDRTLSVRLHRAGRWVPSELATGEQMHLVQLADLDGDHDLDLIATSHDAGAVWAWRNDGTGRFTPAPGSPFAAISAARPHNHGLIAGDLDGDGDADVVAADQEARAAAVLLADGRGGLTAAPSSPIALGGQPYPPALGDLDGNGRLDLVAPLIEDKAIALLLGDGRGGFQHAPGSPFRTARPRPYGVALVDLDADGSLDVIATHDDTDDISILLGDGRGGLRAAPGSPISAGRRLWRPITADIDGDGALDLIGAGSGSLVIMRGNGRGGFGPPQVEPAGGWVAAAADLDGDGRPDLAVPQPGANVIRLWLSRRAAAP